MPIGDETQRNVTKLACQLTEAGTENTIFVDIPAPWPGGGRFVVTEAESRAFFQKIADALAGHPDLTLNFARMSTEGVAEVTPEVAEPTP